VVDHDDRVDGGVEQRARSACVETWPRISLTAISACFLESGKIFRVALLDEVRILRDAAAAD
jgi:hypothetical protein